MAAGTKRQRRPRGGRRRTRDHSEVLPPGAHGLLGNRYRERSRGSVGRIEDVHSDHRARFQGLHCLTIIGHVTDRLPVDRRDHAAAEMSGTVTIEGESPFSGAITFVRKPEGDDMVTAAMSKCVV